MYTKCDWKLTILALANGRRDIWRLYVWLCCSSHTYTNAKIMWMCCGAECGAPSWKSISSVMVSWDWLAVAVVNAAVCFFVFSTVCLICKWYIDCARLLVSFSSRLQAVWTVYLLCSDCHIVLDRYTYHKGFLWTRTISFITDYQYNNSLQYRHTYCQLNIIWCVLSCGGCVKI